MKKNIKSTERVKSLGEVFTDPIFCKEFLKDLSFKKNETILEPSCGNGNFLKEILINKVKNNHNVIDSLKNIYGIDLMKDNILDSRKILFQTAIELGLPEKDWEMAINIIKKNIKQGNTLEVDFETFFD